MTGKGNFKELTGDVDWQFHTLLSYIEKGFKVSPQARAKMSTSELVVQNVVDAYLCLADRFYKQFMTELETTYKQSTDNKQPQDLISAAEVSRLAQKALDKLTAEWARVYGFIAATHAKRTSETEKIITQLSPLIRAAVWDVGFSPDSLPVIPQFGTTYSLGFFNYTDDFLALDLPITALQSPWEWTIFWHEIAGQKVRLLKKARTEFQNVLEEMFTEYKRHLQLYPMDQEDLRKRIRAYIEYAINLIVPFSQLNVLTGTQKSDLFKILTNCVYDDFMNNEDPSITSTRKFIQDLSPARRGLPILMFSFDDLLNEIVDELRLQQKNSVRKRLRTAHTEALAIEETRKDPNKDKIMDDLLAAWDQALSLEETLAAQKKSLDDEGWSADWLEELFEDSFSAKNFDISFLSIFDRLLRRHADGGKDLRHPPHHIRLAAAAALKLIECDESLLNDPLPPQANRFPSNLSDEEIDTLKKYYPGTLSADSLAVVWLAAKRFHEMHKRITVPHDDSAEVIGKAKETIADAMKTHIDNAATSENIAKLAYKILTSLARTILDLSNAPQDATAATQTIVESQYLNKITTLLHSRNMFAPQRNLNFRELLELSFYEVDFGTETYTNIRSPWRNIPVVTLSGPPIEVENGTVLYMDSRNQERKTNRQNWNDKAPFEFEL